MLKDVLQRLLTNSSKRGCLAGFEINCEGSLCVFSSILSLTYAYDYVHFGLCFSTLCRIRIVILI